jgi:hypothetical protein
MSEMNIGRRVLSPKAIERTIASNPTVILLVERDIAMPTESNTKPIRNISGANNATSNPKIGTAPACAASQPVKRKAPPSSKYFMDFDILHLSKRKC